MHPLILTAAAVAQTFNLVCAGTTTTDSDYGGHKTEAYSETYRLDLAAGKWCEADCKFLLDFADVDQTRITFVNEPIDPAVGVGSKFRMVDRQTGEFHAIYTSRIRLLGADSAEWTGHCDKAPFTGFPSFETKF